MSSHSQNNAALSTPGSSGAAPLLKITGLSKSFGGVRALNSVDLDVRAGEVYGLIGSNGAGKSTLIKILSGAVERDEGEILWEGKPYSAGNPQEAYRQGLNFVHQELALIPKFSILQNLTLGMDKPSSFGFINWGATRKSVQEVVERIGIKQPLETIVETLSVADQWLVSIAHALMHQCKIISMDEPTASLSAEESEVLFKVIEDLTGEGIAVIYVSHRLDEVLRLCDRITVFKDGECVLTTNREHATKQMLIEAIVGGVIETAPIIARQGEENRPVVLRADNLCQGEKVKNVSFSLHQGEVLGLGGLVGSGRTELANLIFGLEKPDSGTMLLDGKPYTPADPHAAVQKGVALVPEERRTQGLILKESVGFNLSLADLTSLRIIPGLPITALAKSAVVARSVVERLGIRTPSIRTPVMDLSGGNQQKVVIGKWLNR
ncbi:MAG: sugar ABC transporter ATP-binding protein [Planctomycetes bacterium]|nr:sugar ABC transporter ATP-binding protein [Planctomycetota bacterium]